MEITRQMLQFSVRRSKSAKMEGVQCLEQDSQLTVDSL